MEDCGRVMWAEEVKMREKEKEEGVTWMEWINDREMKGIKF